MGGITANSHNLITATAKRGFLPHPSPPPPHPPPLPRPSPSLLLLSSSPPFPLGMVGRAKDGGREGGVLWTMSNCQSIMLQVHVRYGCTSILPKTFSFNLQSQVTSS